MTVHYRPQIEKELMRAAPMAAVVGEYAIRGGRAAIDSAPRGTGDYEKSIFADVDRDTRGIVGVVFSTDPFAHLVEFGSKNNPAYRPLTRGVEATGLLVTDRGRRG